MVALSPTPSFPGAWPDFSSSDLVPPLPDKPSQDLSPSLICLSPRPVPELPSLSSSLSTAESTVTSRSPTPPEQSASPVEEQLICAPPQTDSPVVLELREPRSPDSAHFSPPDDASSFSSPSSSRTRLSASNVESAATYLPSLSGPDAEGGDEASHSDPPVQVTTNSGSNVVDQQEHLPAVANVTVDKRTLVGKVKRFGGRVRKLFKPRAVETKSRPRPSVSSLVTPHESPDPGEPSLTINVRLSSAEPESARSSQNLDAPPVLPRRFSIQSLLHARALTGSVNSSSRRRLPTIVSAPDDDWLNPLNIDSSDPAAGDVPGIDNHERKADDSTGATTVVRHGLGIETAEPMSATNRDRA